MLPGSQESLDQLKFDNSKKVIGMNMNSWDMEPYNKQKYGREYYDQANSRLQPAVTCRKNPVGSAQEGRTVRGPTSQHAFMPSERNNHQVVPHPGQRKVKMHEPGCRFAEGPPAGYKPGLNPQDIQTQRAIMYGQLAGMNSRPSSAKEQDINNRVPNYGKKPNAPVSHAGTQDFGQVRPKDDTSNRAQSRRQPKRSHYSVPGHNYAPMASPDDFSPVDDWHGRRDIVGQAPTSYKYSTIEGMYGGDIIPPLPTGKKYTRKNQVMESGYSSGGRQSPAGASRNSSAYKDELDELRVETTPGSYKRPQSYVQAMAPELSTARRTVSDGEDVLFNDVF